MQEITDGKINSKFMSVETGLPKDPFEGVDWFESYDREQLQVVEEGIAGKPGWKRYEYYPRVGYFRFIENSDGESLDWHYDIRQSSEVQVS